MGPNTLLGVILFCCALMNVWTTFWDNCQKKAKNKPIESRLNRKSPMERAWNNPLYITCLIDMYQLGTYFYILRETVKLQNHWTRKSWSPNCILQLSESKASASFHKHHQGSIVSYLPLSLESTWAWKRSYDWPLEPHTSRRILKSGVNSHVKIQCVFYLSKCLPYARRIFTSFFFFLKTFSLWWKMFKARTKHSSVR